MHENRYLHLPVVDVKASTVVGVVNVMEILQATAGHKGSARYAKCTTCCRHDVCERVKLSHQDKLAYFLLLSA